MNVLGIETSCDETAAAVVGAEGVMADVIWSQEIHAAYGGVVPELAARAHVEKLGAAVTSALEIAGMERPDAVAATAGPGLQGAVLVGLNLAKGLAAGWGVPFVAVNHLEAHLLASLMEPEPPPWPFLALIVSGGHTTLYRADGLGRYTVLGQTVDDAAGEAFDKVARMLGFGYPGGPEIDRRAGIGNPTAVAFPRPLPGDLDWSFSGLKTSVRTHLMSAERADDNDVAASFQAAVVDCLVTRVRQAAERTGIRHVCVGGGVAANRGLREALGVTGLSLTLPPPRRCTDNAAMVAHAGRMHLVAGHTDPLSTTARASWSLA